MFWTLAHAAPTVVIADDHQLTGEVIVQAAPAPVRTALLDPTFTASVDGGGTTVEIDEKRGACIRATSVSPSAFKTVRYTADYCPTDSGVIGTMVSSNTFDDYRIEWVVRPHAEGSTLTYHLKMETSMMVPQWVIDKTTKKAVLNMLNKLQAHFAQAKSPSNEVTATEAPR